MQLSVDLTGRRVLVVGSVVGTRRVLARYRAAGARVERWDADDALCLRLASASLLPAGRIWPRSRTVATRGSAVSGALTKERKRRSRSGSARVAAHSST